MVTVAGNMCIILIQTDNFLCYQIVKPHLETKPKTIELRLQKVPLLTFCYHYIIGFKGRLSRSSFATEFDNPMETLNPSMTKNFKSKVLIGLLILIMIICAIALKAQDRREYNTKHSFFSEFNISDKISKKFDWQLDFQYRRQSEQQKLQPNAHTGNLFLNPFQTVFRPFIHYYPTADRKVRISLSPIGYWSTFGLAGSNGTVLEPGEVANDKLLQYYELRSTFQFSNFSYIGRAKTHYRVRLERRMMGQKTPSHESDRSGFDMHIFDLNKSILKYRLRMMYRFEVPFSGPTLEAKEFYGAASDEVFVAFGKNVGNSGFFDQNRAYAGIGYKFNSIWKVELGYFNQIQAANTTVVNGQSVRNMDLNHAVHLFVYVDNFSSLFKKKEAAQPAAPKN